MGLSLLLCIFGSCRRHSGRPGGSGAFDWTLTTDQHVNLTDLKGKVVVLDFYATWCDPCRAATPHLVALQQRYGPQGLQIVGLNVGGEDDYEQIPVYAREFSIQYPLGIPEDEFADQYLGVDRSIPQTFVFDKQGRLLRRFIGYDEDQEHELEQAVRGSLAKE